MKNSEIIAKRNMWQETLKENTKKNLLTLLQECKDSSVKNIITFFVERLKSDTEVTISIDTLRISTKKLLSNKDEELVKILIKTSEELLGQHLYNYRTANDHGDSYFDFCYDILENKFIVKYTYDDNLFGSGRLINIIDIELLKKVSIESAVAVTEKSFSQNDPASGIVIIKPDGLLAWVQPAVTK